MKELYQAIAGTEKDMVFVIGLADGCGMQAGQKLLIDDSGVLMGQINGENIVSFAVKTAWQVLSDKKSCIQPFLTGNPLDNQPALYFMYIAKTNRSIKSIAARAVKYYESGKKAWLILDISDPVNWRVNIYYEGSTLTDNMEKKDIESLLQPRAIYLNIHGGLIYSEPLF